MRLIVPWLLVGVVCGCASRGPVPETAPAARAGEVGRECPCRRDTHEQLQSVLWIETSAEYRVLAESTYRAAARAVSAALADPSWTAAVEQTGDPSHLPPAVILDLDETVFDNSGFQGEEVLRREPYRGALWAQWTGDARAGGVPGAREFLAGVRDRGIAVFFVTNRKHAEEPATLRNLAALGIAATPEQVLTTQENGWTSDKTGRREYVARDHRILVLVGDDLNDFIPAELTPEQRVDAAEAHAAWWGTRWFLLPNPMYGSWDRALYGTGLSDEEVLRRKRERVRGFQD